MANSVDENGGTAMHWAASKGHTQVIAALLEGGGDAYAKDTFGGTPLEWASDARHVAATELMQARGAGGKQ